MPWGGAVHSIIRVTFAMHVQCPLRCQLRTFCCLAANDVQGHKATLEPQRNPSKCGDYFQRFDGLRVGSSRGGEPFAKSTTTSFANTPESIKDLSLTCLKSRNIHLRSKVIWGIPEQAIV
jgi:hypothetical protein